ncbi:Store-operated calcium entry-associated regulatory factor [Umbelopsis sp. WA50703]
MRYSVALFAFLLALAAADRNQQAPKKVRLRDLSAITLHADRQTSARRSSPIPQLECVGGDACHDFQPKVVRCQNDGFDGYDVQWTCTANLPDNIEFGDIEVSCEGFDFPEDPFVLVNSCGLEYSLYYKNKAERMVSNDDERYFPKSRPTPSMPSNLDYLISKLFSLISFGVLLVVVWNIYKSCMGRGLGRSGSSGPDRPWFGGDDDNSGGGGFPPGKGGRTYQSPGVGGYGSPGFWSGVGLGGLGAYMLNRQNQQRTAPSQTQRTSQYSGPSRSSPSFSRSYTSEISSPSSSMREASGFGGTRRR